MVSRELSFINGTRYICPSMNCDSFEHKIKLDTCYRNFIKIVLKCGKRIFGNKKANNFNVTGWNDYVKDLYQASREAFLHWRERWGRLGRGLLLTV